MVWPRCGSLNDRGRRTDVHPPSHGDHHSAQDNRVKQVQHIGADNVTAVSAYVNLIITGNSLARLRGTLSMPAIAFD